jgi:hypothetical protein
LYSGDIEDARRRFERLAREAPDRPEGPLFAALALWFSMEADPLDEPLREQYRESVDEALAIARRECGEGRRPRDAGLLTACAGAGLALGARARGRLLEGDTLGAAGDARQARRDLTAVLAFDAKEPSALFGLGLYDYYAAKAPRLVRLLRRLFFLPGGNRARGLSRLEAVRDSEWLGAEARLQLYDIYKYYERDYQRALGCVEELRASHPDNPHYFFLQANLEAHFMGRPHRGRATAEQVLTRVARAEPRHGREVGLWARYARATARFRGDEKTGALEELEGLARERSGSTAFHPIVLATLALYRDLLGLSAQAQYRDAAAALGSPERLRLIEFRLRTVLPPEGDALLTRFVRHFDTFLQLVPNP